MSQARALAQTLNIAITKFQQAKILTKHEHCSICLDVSWITVIYEK